MKKYFSALCACAILIITACKKTPTPSTPASIAQIATIKQTINAGGNYDLLKTFVYDEDEKYLKEIKQSGTNVPMSSERYSYAGSQVQYRLYTNGIEQPNETVNYTLNSKGLIQEKVSTYYGFSSTYEYNDYQFLTKVKYYNKNTLDGYAIYHYSNSNILDSLSFFGRDSLLAYVSIYTWSLNKKNSIGNVNKGLQIFGRDAPYALKKETRFVYNYPNAIGIRARFLELEYDYTYDDRDRIKTSTIIRTDYSYPSGNSSYYTLGVYEYTYQ